MRKTILILAVSMLAPAAWAGPPEPLPRADRAGSADSPFLKRFDRSIIVSYDHKNFDELTVPLSKLMIVDQKNTPWNAFLYEPKQKATLEGDHVRLVYLMPEGTSPLEVLRNYQEEVRAKGGKVIYQCKAEECGGGPTRNIISGGDGGHMGVAEYLFRPDRLMEQERTVAFCAAYASMSDMRYMVAELPSEGVHVSLQTYTAREALYCDPVRGQTFATVDIVAARGRGNKMVTVRAADMAQAITSKGKVALYGIYFDSGKADLKPTSDSTLEQMGKLLKEDPRLKLLVVGHTDNDGTFTSNMELSQRRAAAVVNALASRYGVKKDRLTPVGVSFAAPLESNTTEEGRAKNRRVELVKN